MTARNAIPAPDSTLVGKRVLITGHTGFKGSWLALWLDRCGAKVSGYALDPDQSSLFEEAAIAELLQADIRSDVRDLKELGGALELIRPDVIFHLAAQPLVRRALHDPASTFEINVMGTVNILEAVRISGLSCSVIVVTSDKCYDNVGSALAFAEDDRLGGSEAYGTSKAAAELVVESYRRTFFPPEIYAAHGVRLASVRSGNVIGGGDWAADRIVPDIVRSLAAHQVIEIRRPDAIRPWQHVAVPLSGYIHLAKVLLAGGDPADTASSSWNFGPRPEDELPVGVLVERCLSIWGSGSWRSTADPLALHEAATLRLNTMKARRLLGWRPAWNLDESLRRTLEWYRLWLADPRGDMRAACLRDIEDYESAVSSIQGSGPRDSATSPVYSHLS